MAEDMVVRYCAPTLAGIKTGGMFSCPFQDIRSLRVWLRQINRRLAPKGVRVLSLRYRRGRALIYVYRPGMLCRDLKDIAAIRLLSERGYDCESPGCCIARLARILSGSEPFPHEIGLFLDTRRKMCSVSSRTNHPVSVRDAGRYTAMWILPE